MLQLFRSLSMRYIIQRWDRATLIMASIGLGVATLVSTLIINNCLDQVAHQTTNPIALGNLHVGNGELGFSQQLIDEIKAAKVPGVESMLPIVFDRAELLDFDPPRPSILFGTDPEYLMSTPKEQTTPREKKVDVLGELKLRVEILEKNPLVLLTSKWVLVSSNLYNERKKLGLADNVPLQVRYANSIMSFRIIGVVHFEENSPVAMFSQNLIAMPFDQAAKAIRPPVPPGGMLLTGGLSAGNREFLPERIIRLDIFLEKDANPETVMNRLQEVCGNRAKVRTPEQQRKSTEEVIGGVQISFSLCAVGAIVVGLFLVYNALSVSVAERRHDIGILRSLGATRYQIASIFTSEAIFMGIIGGIIGIPLGMLLSNLAIGQFRDEITSVSGAADLLKIELTGDIAIFALVGGMITALLASLIPAVQAASDQPADAVRRAPSPVAGLLRILHLATCLLFIGGGIAIVALRASLPPRFGAYIGLVCTLVGLFLAMPFFVTFLTRLSQPIFRWLFGVEGRLAADNLIRAPGRTGIVIGALAGGVSLMFQTAGVGRSNEEPVVEWIDQVLQADAFVFVGNIVAASSSSTPMLPYIGEEIRAEVPNVEFVVRQRYYRPEFNGTVIYVQAIDAIEYKKSLFSRTNNVPPGLAKFEQLEKGPYCVVSENFAIRHKKNIGDKIEIPGPKGPVTLEIIDTARDYSWSKGTLFVDRKQYVKLFDDEYVDLFHVFFRQGSNVDIAKSIESLERQMNHHSILVKPRSDVRKFLTDEIDKIYKLAYTQQFLVGVVAALGVVMALLISVLQRRRELGLLRAVGATQTQVLRSVLVEACLMGVLGTLLGIMLGIPLEWYLLRVILFEESGFFFAVLVPWLQTLAIAAIAVGVAILAGLLPAIHAVRLRIAEAIAYE